MTTSEKLFDQVYLFECYKIYLKTSYFFLISVGPHNLNRTIIILFNSLTFVYFCFIFFSGNVDLDIFFTAGVHNNVT